MMLGKRLKIPIHCLLASALIGTFYFWFEILRDYATYSKWQGASIFEIACFVAFLVAGFSAVISLLWSLIVRWSLVAAICPSLMVVSLAITLWFRWELGLLGDRAFFILNFGSFESQIKDNRAGTKIVFRHSSGIYHRVFLYAPDMQVPIGYLSLADVDLLKDGLDAFRGCQISSSPLSKDFYNVWPAPGFVDTHLN